MEKAADHFLIKLEDNIYGVRFNGFKLRDINTNKAYHEYYPKDVYKLDNFKIIFQIKNLILLERHYIGGKLAANFRFVFPVFIQNSSNDVEFIYVIPKLSPEVEAKLEKREYVHSESHSFCRWKINCPQKSKVYLF